MLKCPDCGRKIDGATDGVDFTMPDHQNYMKTAPCPSSGKRFSWAFKRSIDAGIVIEDAPPSMRPVNHQAQLAALALVLGYEGRRRR